MNIVIKRDAHDKVLRYLEPEKVVVVYGPRRVGKTTVLMQVRRELAGKEHILFVRGEDIAAVRPLTLRDTTALHQFVGKATLLIVDEAQLIPDIGLNLKLLVDSLPRLKIIASGSSSFDLAQKIGEPLTGRQSVVRMYPLSASELIAHTTSFEFERRLEDTLVYGSYPEIWLAGSYTEKQRLAQELADAYLYKDLLMLDAVRNRKIIRDLLQLVAYQIGAEVSLHELATILGVDKYTVARYLDLLEQAFVIVNVRGFGRNLRTAVTKKSRYYFYDNGMRNALINNFNAWNMRNDRGALWENWLVMERLKQQHRVSLYAHNYFWRTYTQQEIDWVEEREGRLYGYEFSWQPKTIKKSTRQRFLAAYPDAQLSVVHRENYRDFVT